MKFIANSFSLQMLTMPTNTAKINEITEEMFKELADGAISYIGHEDLANLLGFEHNRESLKLRQGDVLLVAQVTGGRLPVGATTLPENVVLKYFCVQITESNESNLFDNE